MLFPWQRVNKKLREKILEKKATSFSEGEEVRKAASSDGPEPPRPGRGTPEENPPHVRSEPDPEHLRGSAVRRGPEAATFFPDSMTNRELLLRGLDSIHGDTGLPR